MDIGALLSDSFTYAQEALVGKWTRWAIFILFALPISLIQFTFDPKTIVTGTEMNWGAIPWGQIAFLAGLGFILSFFISGYTVRIYRGIKPAPDFTGWADLFVDGVKLAVVWFLWFLPIIVLAAISAVALFSFLSTLETAMPNMTLLLSGLSVPCCGVRPLCGRFTVWNPRCSPVCPDGKHPGRDPVFSDPYDDQDHWMAVIYHSPHRVCHCHVHLCSHFRYPVCNPIHRLGPRPHYKSVLHDLHRPVLLACVRPGRTATGPPGTGSIIHFFF